MELLSHCAEAIVYKDGSTVIKDRVQKTYRHEQLDRSLRQFRARREAKVLQKLEQLNIPAPKFISLTESDTKLHMQHLPGPQVKEVLERSYQTLCPLIGKLAAQLHDADIAHGDLTTSNMIFSNDQIYLIDFGLSAFSSKVEDKAVDLHLLERALESRHHTIFKEAFASVLESYKKHSKDANAILERLDIVRARGRNKHK